MPGDIPGGSNHDVFPDAAACQQRVEVGGGFAPVCALGHDDEQIDIARGVRVATRMRAEQDHALGATVVHDSAHHAVDDPRPFVHVRDERRGVLLAAGAAKLSMARCPARGKSRYRSIARTDDAIRFFPRSSSIHPSITTIPPLNSSAPSRL